MKNVSRYKVENGILIPMIILALISVTTIFSAQQLLTDPSSFYLKQAMWFGVGFILAYLIMYIGNDFLYRNVFILYIIGIISLIALLVFAPTINGSRAWFSIPGIGTIQPSEFMKIILILTLSVFIDDFHEKHTSPSVKEEFLFLLKIGIVVGIPSILTFLQPDTGVVLIYLLITFVMLFISGIRYRWFVIVILSVGLVIGTILGVYFLNTDLFIKIFGTSFFLRVDRLLDWSSGSGYQLENGMTAIGSAGIFGFGRNNTPIYFPEPQTDFIFAVYASNFGFIGSILLLLLLLALDLRLIYIATKTSTNINKYIISGCVAMLIYQQVQNIGMTYGLLPITGITLPFISYGGSSLISYLIMIGIVLNISREEKRKYLN